jgi:hypothetical protein
MSTKICGYCGRENDEEAAECAGCGSAFHEEARPRCGPGFLEWFNQPVSPNLKWYFWHSAWGAVVLATLAIKPAYLLTAPTFPVGLIAWLPNGEYTACIAFMWAAPVMLGWGFYALLSWFLHRTRTSGTFFLVYVIFCLVLALNLVGCHRALEAASGIR